MKKQIEHRKIRYFMYCRRSSDTEDRQVQSIDAQKRELLEFAKEHGLEIVQILEESQSAKAPGRPVFTNMIERINRGEADGLLVWKLNRLARNPIDGGTISWMLQQRIIKHIQTYGNSFYPDDNVIVDHSRLTLSLPIWWPMPEARGEKMVTSVPRSRCNLSWFCSMLSRISSSDIFSAARDGIAALSLPLAAAVCSLRKRCRSLGSVV